MSAALEVLVDGVPSPESWPHDRGLLYGDGLFETMVARGGRIRFEALHRARLAEGCRRLAIRADADGIWALAGAAAARHGEALLRLTLTRGSAVARGYGPSGAEQPRSLISVYAPPPSGEPPAAVPVVSLDAVLGENPALAGLKHCNRLEQVLARQRMQGSGAFEGLMASSSGLLISGTMSNVFVELEDGLVTPAVDRCGIAGVMRAVVLREAARAGIAVQVRPVPFEALRRCRALALSNARLGLLVATTLDGRVLGESPRLSGLAERVAVLDE